MDMEAEVNWLYSEFIKSSQGLESEFSSSDRGSVPYYVEQNRATIAFQEIAKQLGVTLTPLMQTEYCQDHNKNNSWWAKDARGIELRRVCHECKHLLVQTYRLEVLTNPNYDACEDIDG